MSAGLSFLQAECAGQDHKHTTAGSPQLLLERDKEDVSISGSRHSSPAAAAPKARCWFFLSQPVRSPLFQLWRGPNRHLSTTSLYLSNQSCGSLSSRPVPSRPDDVGVFPLLSFSEGCHSVGVGVAWPANFWVIAIVVAGFLKERVTTVTTHLPDVARATAELRSTVATATTGLFLP